MSLDDASHVDPAGDAVPLAKHVETVLDDYFQRLGGHSTIDLYVLIMGEVEKSLLEVVMREVGGNQTRAAEILGINRTTLRKKLRHHSLV